MLVSNVTKPGLLVQNTNSKKWRKLIEKSFFLEKGLLLKSHSVMPEKCFWNLDFSRFSSSETIETEISTFVYIGLVSHSKSQIRTGSSQLSTTFSTLLKILPGFQPVESCLVGFSHLNQSFQKVTHSTRPYSK